MNISGNYVKALVFDKHGNLYIGTDNGLYVKNGDNIRQFRHDSSNPLTIQNNIICDIYIDPLQNVWLGNNIGVSMIPNNPLCNVFPLSLLTGSHEGNLIDCISQDADNSLWFGGTDGLIHCFDDHADWYRQSGTDLRILHNRIRNIRNDRDGDVWILTDHGINFYDKKTRAMRNFIVESTDGRFSSNWAYDLCMDQQGNLWIASYSEGVFRRE